MYLYAISLLILLIELQSKQIDSQHTVKISLIQMIDSLTLNFAIGDPLVTWFKSINQASDINWIGNSFYSPNISNSSIKLSTIDERDIIEDTWISDFEITKTIYPKFKYLFIKNNEKKYSQYNDGWIGFAYKYRDESYSITHILKQNNYTNYLSYSFIFKERLGKQVIAIQEIIIGKIPAEIIENKHIGHCKVLPSQSKWSCKMPQVTIGNISYNNHYEAYFQAYFYEIYIPHEFMEIITQNIFMIYINNGQCKIVSKRFKYFECDKEVMEKLPNITFQFDNYSYSFHMAELFRLQKKIMKSNIGEHPDYSTSWVIGGAFLSYFNSMYDYEKSQVVLFSNENDRIKDITKYMPSIHALEKNILRVICLIIILGLCCIAYSKKVHKI